MDFGNIIDAALSQALGPQAIVFALAAIGLNIHFGYTGLLNFGQSGFMAIAGFGLAVSVVRFDLPFFVGVLIALVTPVLLALVLGVPTLRLRADYLAIVTIASSEILRLILGAVEFKDVFGGSNGLTGFVRPFQDLNPYSGPLDLGIVSWSRSDLWSLTVGWILVALGCLLVWALMRSPWGRILRSIREDEDAVRSLGKNVFSYKLQALILGGVFGGLAGLFHVLKQGSAVPTDFNTTFTFYAYAALLVGGAARVLGPVVGSIIFWFLVAGLGELFDQLTDGSGVNLPTWLMTDTQASLVRFIVLGLGLMLLMIFRPQGIFGDRREIAIDAR
ncbi:branched-chain amino acid ABC transporter permease [Aeromicrobium sp. Root495]|uniref:branched-chain amino acid ABC transporter permease n=1 Tax=Aeromicrobium sp. Root495 TaxID=1736550 RepID=UPI0006FFBA13|nr:branched-chain amino acid ABC transporter permease [Aeromicrobium sp. Root495]KQY59077.1 branched-chain amino acid ABC transporter permease [Aeromicrobium sp. Root495]RYJ07018.1 MAG: branched-chain amino acid ABC transporter permease [Actinomycetales bacterium]